MSTTLVATPKWQPVETVCTDGSNGPQKVGLTFNLSRGRCLNAPIVVAPSCGFGGTPAMSQHKTDATKFVELADKQNYVPDTRGFQVDANDVYEKLVQSDRPLSRSDVQQLAHRSEAEAQRRLNRLVSEGKVEKRHDGPDGRIVYYQPAGMDYEWPNGGDGK